MNSTLGLHAPCQAATAKVLRHAPFYAHPSLSVIHIKVRKIFARWPPQSEPRQPAYCLRS
jgi:hypothetical protein